MNRKTCRCLFAVAFLVPHGLHVQERAQSAESATVRVAGIVLKSLPKEKEENVRRAEPLIRQAVVGGAQIVCNTECFWGGYAMGEESLSMEALRGLGEPIPDGPYYMRLSQLASGGKVCAQQARSPTKKLVRS